MTDHRTDRNPAAPDSGGARELAEVLDAHEPDVTSYDAGDIHGCECGWMLPDDLGWDDKWPAYRAHRADALLASPQFARLIAEAKAEALREARSDLSRDAVEFRPGWGSGNREDLAALDALGKALAWLDDRAALTTEAAQ